MVRLFYRYSRIEFARANCGPDEKVVFEPHRDFLRPFVVVPKARTTLSSIGQSAARRTYLET